VIADSPRAQVPFLDDSPTLLMLIMAPDFRDMHLALREYLSRSVNDKVAESFYTGFCFGKYDLIAEVKTDTVRKAFNLAHDVQSMIVDTQAEACSSIVLCHEISMSAGLREPHPMKDCAIRSFSLFRIKGISVDNLSIYSEILTEDQNPKQEIRRTLFWNRSYYSHILRIGSDRFDTIHHSVYSFRQSIGFPKDFCTFATLGFNRVDDLSLHPIRALINLKICDETTVDRIRREFPNAFFRFGYFDLIIPVETSRLSEIQAIIARARQLLTQQQPSNRSATILCFVEPYEGLTGGPT